MGAGGAVVGKEGRLEEYIGKTVEVGGGEVVVTGREGIL